jgi:predicted branched-subunit amino acid permease
MAMKEYHGGYRDAGYVLGSGVAMFVPWVGGTLAGHLLAHSVPNPAQFGLDFMLVAFAAAIGISVWRGKADLWPAAVAALVAFALHKLVPGGWYIVGAGLAGAVVGALRHGR